MLAAVVKSFKDCGTSTEDNVEMKKTDGENINTPAVSVYSSISCSTAKRDADPTVVEDGQHQKKLEELQEDDMNKEVAYSLYAGTLGAESCIPAAGTEFSVWPNGNMSQNMQKLKQVTPEQSDGEANDLRKAHITKLAKEKSISAELHNASRLLVRSEVAEESVKLVRDGLVVVVENDDSDDTTVLRMSIMSPKSCKTDHYETNCDAASLASSRHAKSQKVTECSSVDDINASVSSLRSNKRYKRTRNKTEKSEASSRPVSLLSGRSDISQDAPVSSSVNHVTALENCLNPDAAQKVTRNHTCMSEASSQVMSLGSDKLRESAKSRYVADVSSTKTSSQSFEMVDGVTKSKSHGASHLSVQPGTDSKGSHEVESGSSTLGCKLSVTSLDSEVSSDASSVIIPKPPKHTAINKARSDHCTAAAAESAESGCMPGEDSILFILYLSLQHFNICIMYLLKSHQDVNINVAFKSLISSMPLCFLVMNLGTYCRYCSIQFDISIFNTHIASHNG